MFVRQQSSSSLPLFVHCYYSWQPTVNQWKSVKPLDGICQSKTPKVPLNRDLGVHTFAKNALSTKFFLNLNEYLMGM